MYLLVVSQYEARLCDWPICSIVIIRLRTLISEDMIAVRQMFNLCCYN